MATVVGWIFAIFIILWIVSKFINSISKSAQKIQGRNRCVACKSWLKAVNGRYAGTCRRCGRTQPWAVQAGGPASGWQ